MLEQIEWFITEHFKHPPTIGTRVKIGKLKNYRTGTVFCHIEGINKQSKMIIHQNLPPPPTLSPDEYMYVLVEFRSYSMTS